MVRVAVDTVPAATSDNSSNNSNDNDRRYVLAALGVLVDANSSAGGGLVNDTVPLDQQSWQVRKCCDAFLQSDFSLIYQLTFIFILSILVYRSCWWLGRIAQRTNQQRQRTKQE